MVLALISLFIFINYTRTFLEFILEYFKVLQVLGHKTKEIY